MKHILTVSLAVFFLLNYNPVSAQSKEVRFLIDTCITIMKANAVNADKVDLDKVKAKALTMAAGMENTYDIGPVMRYIYQSLNDFHGKFFYKDSSFQWSHEEPVISDSIRNEWKHHVNVTTMILENNTGYLRVPSMMFGKKEKLDKDAQELNDSLCSLLKRNVRGIVLDLRLNGGGAMFPMILGLEQLLPEGKLGTFFGKTKSDWLVKQNGFYTDTTLITSIVPSCTVNAQRIPVVMLVSPATGSSAEFLIMSFMGRPNTILLGSKTAGYVTIISGMPVNEAAYMYISTGYAADRNGKVYKEAIAPDMPMEAIDKFNDIQNDEKVKAAVKWLRKH